MVGLFSVRFLGWFAVRSSVGFCGSRHLVRVPSVVSAVFSSVPAGASVSVGCARGLDSLVRSAFPSAVVFRASSFGVGRSSFVRRSVAFVSCLASSPAPVLVCVPACACPVGLVPSPSSSACFCGLGSGSWASAALAVGLGVPVLVWLPSGVLPPVGWGFVSVSSGWFLCLPPSFMG